MLKKRFFATLHMARKLQTPDKILRELLLKVYMAGWTDCYAERIKHE